MILHKIHIENFGAFHDFELELHEGLNELSRPNEFGKTTILEFIRRIFWGFPDHRSRANLYPQLHGTGAYGGWLEVEMRSGEKLKLERCGERAELRVIAADGSVTEGPDIRILSNCSERFYNSIGAITIDELNGAAMLDDEEIRTRLYGGGLNGGNVPISQIRKELERRADEIYTKTGTRNKLLKMSQEFAESDAKTVEASGHLELYRKALKHASEQNQLAESLRQKIDSARKAYETLKSRSKAAFQYTGILAAEEALKKQPLPPVPQMPEIPEQLKENCETVRARTVEEKAIVQAETLLKGRIETEKSIAELPQEQFLAPPPEPSVVPLLSSACCNAAAAEPVDEASLEAAKEIPEKQKMILRLWKKTKLLPFISYLLLVLTAAALIYGCYKRLLDLLVLAGVFFITAIALIVKNKCQELKIEKLRQELSQIVPELARRFALGGGIKADMCYAVLLDLREYQEFQAEYQRAFAEYEQTERVFLANQRRRQQIKDALIQGLKTTEMNLQRLCFDYAVRPDFPPEKLPELLRLLQNYQEQENCAFRQKREYEKALAERRQQEQKIAVRRESLIAEFGQMPPEVIPPEALERAETDLNELQRKLEQTLGEEGGFRRESERLRQLSDTSDELNIREQIRGEMTEAARDYLRYRAALLLLERTVARGERMHQGVVLQQGSALFADFTGNRYTTVFKSMESGELLVVDSVTGLEKRIPELSRGTKEQLLLALRLALIASFEAENEPLPIILDDVLVNFDCARQAAVRQGLEKFSRERQILLLSAER